MREARHIKERPWATLSSILAALFVTTLVSLTLSPSLPFAAAACPNEAFRTGPSAQLPDCRAYEMMTPPDSNGRRFGDAGGGPLGGIYDLFPHELKSPLRPSFLFITLAAALNEPSGGNGRPDGDVWETVREPLGWRIARHLSPKSEETVAPTTGGVSLDHEYIFTFVPHFADAGKNGPLGRDGEADYLGDSNGSFELVGVGELGTERLAQGRYISPGGEHVIFSTGRSLLESGWCQRNQQCKNSSAFPKKLEPEAPPNGTGAIYDRPANGSTQVVSLLPGNVTPSAGQNATYQGVSATGSIVAFEIAGTLYVRVNNQVTKPVAGGNPTYGGFSADGTYLFYVSGGDIHRFTTASEEDEVINTVGEIPTTSGDAQMVNVSADGSHVYFISPSQLDGTEGTVGQPNMYVWSGGSPEYIATVDPTDTAGAPALTNWAGHAVAPNDGEGRGPGAASSRTTPDGSVIVFESRAQLTSYDNDGHIEIYRYEEEDESPQCVSCNPSEAPATVGARLQDLGSLSRMTIISNVTADGSRVFFETTEALVDTDVDSLNDIYQWQEMVSEGSPTLSLISSGNSVAYPQIPGIPSNTNVLMGVSPNGTDVFFVSQEALVPGAGVGGAPAIYTAHIDGGFPQPPFPPPPCIGSTACQGEGSPPPPLVGAQSQTRAGSGNVKPRKRHRCNHRKHRKLGQKQRSCQRQKARGVVKSD